MKAQFILAAVVLLVPVSVVSGQEYLKVGSWNIENLGSRTPPQHQIAIAEHIQLSGVDVLALNEIHDEDGQPGTRTNKVLDKAFAILNGQQGQDWR